MLQMWKEYPHDASNGGANSGIEHNSHIGMDDIAEMDRAGMEDDDIHEIGEGRLNDAVCLTGNPLIFYAVSVCGPYSVVQF